MESAIWLPSLISTIASLYKWIGPAGMAAARIGNTDHSLINRSHVEPHVGGIRMFIAYWTSPSILQLIVTKDAECARNRCAYMLAGRRGANWIEPTRQVLLY
jgi:hypothetical protein